jgi:hypothetical protein
VIIKLKYLAYTALILCMHYETNKIQSAQITATVELKFQQDMQCTYNVTWKRVRVTIVAVQEQ